MTTTPDNAVADISPEMVRGLRWEPDFGAELYADSIVGRYQIHGNFELGYCVLCHGTNINRSCNTEEDARSAAQADYASRIASALSAAFIERIGALEAEREQWREAARCVVGADLPKYIRALVAGWNGDGRPDRERFGRHPVTLGATIPTTCGAVYELDEAVRCLANLFGLNDDARTAIQEPTNVEDGGS